MRRPPSARPPTIALLSLAGVTISALIMVLSPLGTSSPAPDPRLPTGSSVLAPTPTQDHGAGVALARPHGGPNPPTLTTAITNAPKVIYTYQNQQELFPQVTQVNLYANATGHAVASYANVQVAFVVETTLYDGVYDPTQGDYGVNNPCTGPCEESDAVPFFTANAGRIAQDISGNNPYTNVTFSMVDYFATLTDHDDGDGSEYHVDVGSFVPASQFQSDVTTGFQTPVLNGNWYYFDSDFSDCFLDTSEITALYGALKGSGLAWNPSDHHVIVIIGSTAPRDPNYLVNYAGSHSDWNSGWSSSCEPSYNYGGGVKSPQCEEWNGTGTNNITALANSENVNVDYIDVFNGITDSTSQDYVSAAYASATSKTILSAGCDMAEATGGTWNGPPGFYCSAAETGTGYGNLTCSMGTSCFQGQSGSYNNPPRSWADNYALGWAITHISFGPVATSNVTATSNGVPMFQFVPATNITIDPTNPGWTVTCISHGKALAGCQQAPSITSSGNVNIYGWNWPVASMVLNDSWEATFNVVAVGSPFNLSRPVDACTDTGCMGPVGPAPGVFSDIDYKNYQGYAVQTSFPAADVLVVYPGMNVVVTPAYSRGTVGFTQTFTVAVTGGQPPFTYQWDLNGYPQAGATASTFTYTFNTSGTFVVRCLVWDSYGKGVSGTAQVYIVPPLGAYFYVEGNVTDASTGNPIGGAVVAFNGTLGSTYSALNGSYSLGPVVNGTYTLFVNATNYRPYVAAITVAGTAWVNVALTPAPASGYSIQGFLTSFANSTPIGGASITLTFQGSPFGHAITTGTGYFFLTSVFNATYQLGGTASGFAPTTLSVVVAGASVWQNFSLTPLPPQTYYITGSVLSSVNRLPIAGAQAELNFVVTTTTSAGIFTFLGLANGTYFLNVTASGFYAFTHTYYIRGAGQSLTIILTPIPPPPPVSYSVGGTVLDADTLFPIANASVEVEGPGGSPVQTATAGISGDYDVSGLQNDSYTVLVSAAGYGQATAGFTIAGADVALNLYLIPTGVGRVGYYEFQGVVVDALTHLTIPDAQVNLTPDDLSQVTSSEGTFSFRLTNNSYDLMVTKAGYHPYANTVLVDGQDASAEVQLVPLSLSLYPISGLVYDEATNTPIEGSFVHVLGPSSPPVLPTNSTATGGFDLIAGNGSYVVEATAPGFHPGFLNVTVQGSTVGGAVFYLVPISAPTQSTPSSCNPLTCPGPFGLYLQLWVPAVVAAGVFLLAFTRLRRKHAQAPGKDGPTPPEGGAAADAAGTSETTAPHL